MYILPPPRCLISCRASPVAPTQVPDILPCISHLTLLRVLELGSNRIKKVRPRVPGDPTTSRISLNKWQYDCPIHPVSPSHLCTMSPQIENLETLVHLQELWLGRNRITQVS